MEKAANISVNRNIYFQTLKTKQIFPFFYMNNTESLFGQGVINQCCAGTVRSICI